MELHTKQLQISMNSAVADKLCSPPKCAGLFNWRTVVINQNKRNHCIVAQSVAHIKNLT